MIGCTRPGKGRTSGIAIHELAQLLYAGNAPVVMPAFSKGPAAEGALGKGHVGGLGTDVFGEDASVHFYLIADKIFQVSAIHHMLRASRISYIHDLLVGHVQVLAYAQGAVGLHIQYIGIGGEIIGRALQAEATGFISDPEISTYGL